MRRAARIALLIAAAIALVLMLAGCAAFDHAGRQVATLHEDLGSVRTVNLHGGTLKIVQGKPAHLTIEAEGRMVPWIVDKRPQADTLELGIPDDSDVRSLAMGLMPTDGTLVFTLTVPDLKRIELGDGTVLVDQWAGESLELDANLGTARMKNIFVNEWICSMNGGVAKVVVTGIAPIQRVSNSSGSLYDDSGLKGYQK